MSFQSTLNRYNPTLSTDITGILGVTIGVVAGQYIAVHVNLANSQYAGALIDVVLGLMIVVLFNKEGLINGIGLGIAGYGLYKIINIASNGAI